MGTILWIKALHVAFMVAWFAGIFYLPRLFVYHAETNNNDVHQQFKVMERRLLYFITPFAILTVVFGLILIHLLGYHWFAASHWLHAKLVLVMILIAYHAYCFKLLSDFKNDRNSRSGKFYRIFNEMPVFILFGSIILAIGKPIF